MKANQTNKSICVQISGSGRSDPPGAPSSIPPPGVCTFAFHGGGTMIYDIAVNGLLAAYCQSEADEKLIRAACEAIFQAGVGIGVHQGLLAAKEAFAAEGEAKL